MAQVTFKTQKPPPTLTGAKSSTSGHLDLYEARECLLRLSLQSVNLRDYWVIMRSDFDVEIAGEPYVAYILLFHPKSGLYLARVWNQTVATGYATNAQELQDACALHFSQGRPCIGFPLRDQRQDGSRFLISQSPVPRMISKQCHRAIQGDEALSCSECLDLDEKPHVSEVSLGTNDFNPSSDPGESGELGLEENPNASEDIRLGTSDFAPTSEAEKRVIKQESYSYDDDFDPGGQELTDRDVDLTNSQMPDLSEATPENDGICLVQVSKKNMRGKKEQQNANKQIKQAVETKIKCPWCDEIFLWGSGLLTLHKKICHFHGSFKCKDCPFKTTFARDLVDHVNREDHGFRSHHCPKCRERFTLFGLLGHFAECKTVHCSVCLSTQFTSADILDHYKKCVEEWKGKCGYQHCGKCKVRFHKAEFFHHTLDCEGLKPSCLPSQSGHVRSHPKEEERAWNYSPDDEKLQDTATVAECQIELAKTFNGSVSRTPIRFKSAKPVVLKVLKGANISGMGNIPGPKVVMLKRTLLKKNAADVSCTESSLSKRKKVTCTWCNKIMFHNKYEYHKRRSHHWGEFKCPECSAEASFAKDLIEHMKHHEELQEESQETLAECPTCKNSYNIKILEAHYKSCVAQKVWNVVCDFCSESMHFMSEKEHNRKRHRFYGLLECTTCHVEADFAEDIVAHITSPGHGHGLVRCPICEEAIPPAEIGNHCEDCDARKREDRAVMCSQCGKKLTCREALRIHTRNMHPNRGAPEEYPCDICGRVFKGKDPLRHHVKMAHKSIPCSICKAMLPKNQMKTHQRREHGIGIENLQCSECGHISQTKDLFNKHMRWHQEPQLKCRFCDKKLKTRTNLIAHERQHTGEKPFPCQICSAGFTKEDSLRQHMRGVHKIAKRGGQTGWYRKQKKARVENETEGNIPN